MKIAAPLGMGKVVKNKSHGQKNKLEITHVSGLKMA